MAEKKKKTKKKKPHTEKQITKRSSKKKKSQQNIETTEKWTIHSSSLSKMWKLNFSSNLWFVVHT